VSKKYQGSIDVAFDSLPALVPQLLDTQSDNPLERYNGSGQRRTFHLVDDWQINIAKAAYDEDLSGEIFIPSEYEGKKTEFNGTSVPLPGLVKIASFGILRPLGAMLTASIVHDFAYQHGGLLYKKEDGTTQFRAIRRDLIDKLFCDIIGTVNNLPLTSKIALFAARLGYFGVKYNNKVRDGEFPAIALAALAGILLVFWGYFSLFGFTAGIIILAVVYSVLTLVISLGGKEEISITPTKPKEGPEATT